MERMGATARVVGSRDLFPALNHEVLSDSYIPLRKIVTNLYSRDANQIWNHAITLD